MESSTKSLYLSRTLSSSGRVVVFHTLGFLFLCALPLALSWNLTAALCGLILRDDSFSQILLVPAVSCLIVFENRKAIFSEVTPGWIVGGAMVTPGLIVLAAARLNVWHLGLANQSVLFVVSIVLIWLGAFALCFGSRAFRRACFPLLFLLFCIPIPEPLLTRVISILQEGSADAAEIFFRLGGVPYFRHDAIFELPGISIWVAAECSGIRSSLALLITTVLASYLFLKKTGKRLLLCVFAIPLAILKNGLRIAALSWLAIYVDPGFLRGRLHHQGGIVFFAIALIPMAVLLVLLQKSENSRAMAMRNT
jgi:exosortase